VHKIISSFILSFLALGILSCNLLTVDNKASDYPTFFPVYEFSELQKITFEYQQANDNHICSTLNKFGFTGYSEIFFEDGESPCAGREIVREEISDFDTLVTAAKTVLLKNQDYTGVTDTSELEVTDLLPISGCTICEGPDYNNVPIELKITFAGQRVDSIQVIGTSITVFVDAEGVNRIWGNWYEDFEIPAFVNFGYEEVQAGLVGWQIDMRSYTGEEVIYRVEQQDVDIKPARVYLPYENESGMELTVRSCWAVPVDYSGNNFEGWIAYVDIEEGFLVDLKAR
jgi:hypothetical protein